MIKRTITNKEFIKQYNEIEQEIQDLMNMRFNFKVNEQVEEKSIFKKIIEGVNNFFKDIDKFFDFITPFIFAIMIKIGLICLVLLCLMR